MTTTPIRPRLSRFLIVAACGLVAIAHSSDTAAQPRIFLHNADALARNRADIQAGDSRLAPAIDKLKRDADAALTAGPFSVMHKKTTSASGDKHDYLSYGPYFWPDPDKPDGLPYIRRDGERNPSRNEISDHAELGDMASAVETLALAYYFTGDAKYAERAALLLRTWFIDPTTRMNPNLQYAQATRGMNTGRCYGIIEGRSFIQVADSIGLLADWKAWKPADGRALRNWYEQYYRWLTESEFGQGESQRPNNHGTNYDVQVVVYALFLDKPDAARKILNAVKTERIATQIEPDGREPLELARTRSWEYSYLNLYALMQLATLGEKNDVDLWHYETSDGRGIRAVVEYMAPFGLRQKHWPHQQIGGLSPKLIYPLLRQAAERYPNASFRGRLSKIQPRAADRENLLQSR